MSDTQLLQKIKDTIIFNDSFKNQLIKYFHQLSDKQKEIVAKTLASEKQILLGYLKTLKDEGNINFTIIKQNIQNITKQKIKLAEQREQEAENVEDILLSLDYV